MCSDVSARSHTGELWLGGGWEGRGKWGLPWPPVGECHTGKPWVRWGSLDVPCTPRCVAHAARSPQSAHLLT